MEIIFDILIEFCSLPGAILLYIFSNKKLKFKEFYETNYVQSTIVGLGFWFLIGLTIAYFGS